MAIAHPVTLFETVHVAYVARPARGRIAQAMIDFHRLPALVLKNCGQHSAREPYNSNRW